ncbi:MAG: TetR-family transcriptional regulator [Clostridia bacterium]|jgi:AcrR family transcriptional regulator|nr:TetR-family transcriptional regulator [Clostridia bacterium]
MKGITLKNEKKLDARTRILESAWNILQEKKDPNAVTVRDIAARAEVGIGLINYHFESKDKMLMEASGNAMKMAAAVWQDLADNEETDPKEGLFQMLTQLSDMGSDYEYLIKMAARSELLEGEVSTPLFILPYVKRITGLEDTEARLAAFALIAAIQSAVLRTDVFEGYSGYNIQDKKERDKMIAKLIEVCL